MANETDKLRQVLLESARNAADPSLYDRTVNDIENKKADLTLKRDKNLAAVSDFRKHAEKQQQISSKIAGWGIDSDLAKEVSEGAVRGSASTYGGFGDLIELGGKAVESGFDAIGLGDALDKADAFLRDVGVVAPSEIIQGSENAANRFADDINTSQTPQFRGEMKRTTPAGDITDPSSWSLGEDPSAEGAIGQLAGMAGQFVPQALTMMATAGMGNTASMLATGATGALQAGGGASDDAYRYVMEEVSQQELSQSPLYLDLVEKQGMTPTEAREAVADTAKLAGFSGAAPVGFVGGAATRYILGPLQGKLGQSLAGRAIGGSVISGAEEGVQEVAEGVAAKEMANAFTGLDRDTTEGSFGDFVMGAGFGASLNAAPVAAEAAGRVAGKAAEVGKETVDKQTGIQAAVKKARETGEIDSLVDPESKTYQPSKAAGALFDRLNDDSLGEEEKAQTKETLKGLVNRMADETLVMQDTVELFDPKGMEKAKEKLAQRQEKLETIPESDTEARENLEFLIEDQQERIARVEALPEKWVKRIQREFDTHVKRQENVERIFDRTQEITEAKNPVEEVIRNPDAYSSDQIAEMISNADLNLSDSQRTFLRKFNDAQIARNRMKDTAGVSNDVFSGGEGFKGLPVYEKGMNKAVQTGNQKRADKELAGAKSFAQSREQKLQTMEQALILSNEQDGKQVQVVYDAADQIWGIHDGERLTDKQLEKNGGLNVSAKSSSGLIEAVRVETEAVRATADQLQAAYDMAFTGKTTPTTESGSLTDEGTKPTVTETPATEPTEPVGKADSVVETTDESITANTQDTTTVDKGLNSEKAAESRNEPVEATTEEETDVEKTEGTSEPAKAEQAVTKANETEFSQKYDRRKGKKTDRTGQALVLEDDFISKLDGKPELLDQYISEPLNEEQIRHFQTFKGVVSEWSAAFPGNLRLPTSDRDREFFYKDPIMLLLESNPEGDPEVVERLAKAAGSRVMKTKFRGKVTVKERESKAQAAYNYIKQNPMDLPENVKTALVFAGFNYVAENATSSPYNDKKTINTILGRDEDHQVSKEELVLVTAGTNEKLVISSLGKAAMQAMGISPKKTTPLNEVARMEGSLGGHVLGVLLQRGIVERVDVPGSVFANAETKNSDASHSFIRFKREWGPDNQAGDLAPEAERIADSAKGTKGFLAKVFRAEAGKTGPSFEPITKVQKKAKGTRQDVAAIQKEILEQEGQRAHYLRPEIVSIFDQMTDEELGEVAGVKGNNPGLVHKANRMGRDGKNDGLMREIAHMREFLESVDNDPDGTRDQKFYFGRSVWRMGRVGLASNTINPQTSKIHRHMIAMDGWKSEIHLDNHDGSLDNFKLAIAEAIGVDTDKQLNLVSLPEFEKKIAEDTVRKAVKALTKSINGEVLTDSDRQDIIAGVGKHGFHGLDGLTELARYEQSVKLGESSFESDIMREVDGVTNGPMLTLLQLAADKTVEGLQKLLNKGGFFEGGNAHQQYTEWKSQSGNEDLYQSTAFDVTQHLAQNYQLNPTVRPVYDGVFHFLGNFTDGDGAVTSDGRKAVKTPLTGFAFGSGVDTAVGNMAMDVIDAYYTKIEEAKASNDTAALKTTIQKANALIRAGGNTGLLNESMGFDTAMELELTSQQEKAIINAFSQTVGSSVADVMEQKFASLIETRNKLNTAARVAFQMYDVVYTAARKQYMDKLVAAGKIILNEKGEPTHGLNQEQENEVRKMVKSLEPVVHTPMSKHSEQLSAGLNMSKVMNEISQDPMYGAEVRFGRNVPKNDDQGSYLRSLRARGMVQKETDPGVATVIMLIHALDSTISGFSYRLRPALNVHDAHGLGLNAVAEGAKELNRQTFQLNRDYSLPLEVTAAMERSMKNYVKFSKDNPELADELRKGYKEIQEDLRKNMAEVLPEIQTKGKDPVQIFYSDLGNTALETTERKLSVMKNLTSVDQYALEGGNFVIPDIERTRIQKTLDSIRLKRAAMGKALSEPYGDKESTKKVKPESMGKVNQVLAYSDWDKAIQESDNAAELIRKVFPAIPDRLRGIAKGLAKHPMVKQASVEVGSVTAGRYRYTPGGNGTVELNLDALVKGNKDFGPEYSTVVLIHEAMHAATVGAINPVGVNRDQPYEKQTVSEQAAALTDHVKQWLNTNKESLSKRDQQIMAKATENGKELIAWGMTDPDVQRVLEQVPGISRAKSVFDDVVRLVLKALGLDQNQKSALRDVIRLASRASETTRKQAGDAEQSVNADLNLDQGIERVTTDQVFDALDNGQSEPGFRNHLKHVMKRVVENVHGPYGAYLHEAKQKATYTPEDAFLKALATGSNPFASEALGTLTLSNSELFVLEQVEMVTQEALGSSHVAYRELQKLYKEAKERLSASDFPDAGAYELLFNGKGAKDGTSDYLARFAAAGMAYKPLHDLLAGMQTGKPGKTFQQMTLAEKLRHILDMALQALNGRLTKTFVGQRGDEKLERLLEQLVDHEAKKKAGIVYRRNAALDKLENGTKVLVEKGRQGLAALGESNLIQKAPLKSIRALGSITAVVAKDRAHLMIEGIEKASNENAKGQQGVASSLLSELKGATDLNRVFYKLLRQSNKNEQQRKHLITTVGRLVSDSFKRKLSRNEKESLTRAVIRTDLGTLMTRYSMEELTNMVNRPEAVDAEISAIEQKLSGSFKHYYSRSAKDLGYHLATGKTVGDNLMMNAHNIAYLVNTKHFGKVSDQQAEKAMGDIDTLASLYAVKYLPSNIREQAANIMVEELSRGPENGVETVLRVHSDLKRKAMESSFGGSPVHFVKGYTKEIYDPRREVVVADEEQGKNLVRMGYVKKGKVQPDSVDGDKTTKHLYVIADKGLSPHVTGIISFTGKRAKGSRVNGGLVTENGEINQTNLAMTKGIQNRASTRIDTMFKASPNYDPRTVNGNRLVPVVNEAGDLANYRYMMNDETRDSALNRDNQIDNVLGAMAGSTLDKAETESQNRRTVSALREQYNQEYANSPEAYIEFGPDSTDPEVRETYRLLPDKTRQDIKDIWGKNSMMIRRDLYDMTFGYRKYSLSDTWNKSTKERSILENVFVDTVEALFGKKAALRIRQAEDIWLELVQMTKDILVIKNLFTLLGNIMSNVSLLVWMGVNPVQLVKTHTTAIRGLVNYKKDRNELTRLEALQDAGYATDKDAGDIAQRIVELNDALNRNPVKGLIDAGLYQTIVEDVEDENNEFSYTSRLSRWTDGKTQWMPEGMKTVGKTLFMAHDTPVYQLLNQATSMSDFVGRYTLYEHMTTREKRPMSHDDAVQLASDAFVNYDIPTHKAMQYLNDTGLVWFTKYYMRIQKVILHLYRDNPGRGIGIITLENLFPGLATLLDSGFWNSMGNPFSYGAFKLPESLDEILLLKTLFSPFR